MDPTATRPPIEFLAEWSAALLLVAAVAFALVMLASASMVVMACGGAGAAAAAVAVQRWVPHGLGRNFPGFEPVDWAVTAEGEEEVLLLEEPLPVEADQELLLDDPLPAPDRSRVVRLFGDAPGGDAEAIPAPGEMLARIETFLGGHRSAAPLAAVPAPEAEASAALHAALADIRRSLRQG